MIKLKKEIICKIKPSGITSVISAIIAFILTCLLKENSRISDIFLIASFFFVIRSVYLKYAFSFTVTQTKKHNKTPLKLYKAWKLKTPFYNQVL